MKLPFIQCEMVFGAVEHLLGYEQFTMAELLDWGADNGVPLPD